MARAPDLRLSSLRRRARAAGRYVGMGMGPDLEHATRAASQGVQWVQCGCDFSFMIDAVDDLFARIRQQRLMPKNASN